MGGGRGGCRGGSGLGACEGGGLRGKGVRTSNAWRSILPLTDHGRLEQKICVLETGRSWRAGVDMAARGEGRERKWERGEGGASRGPPAVRGVSRQIR